MKIPLVDLKAQYATLRPEIDETILGVLERAQFILGPEVAEFEGEFARFVGAAEAVGVGSGTSAIHLALLACGVGPGDEVITTPHTFIATAEAISHAGARPVFVDIDPVSYNIDPDLVEAAITPRTRAILPVHLYGQPADLGPLMEIAERRGLHLIEDAAQAHGAEYCGRRCGSIGHLACFSFYPGKNLGAYGDAGAVTGNDPDLVASVRRLRDHGRTTKYEHEEVGYGERMDTVHAALLSVKLRRLEEWTEARRAAARLYTELLSGADVATPVESPDVRHVYHLYVIRSTRRDALLQHLQQNGVGAGIHYPLPLHRQPAYMKLGIGGSFPETERAAAEVLSLPLYPEISDEQVRYVAEQVRSFAA